MNITSLSIEELKSQIQGGVIVSCQAIAGSPLSSPEIIAAFAATAELNGAVGVRIDTPEHISRVRKAVSVPIFGIYKMTVPGFEVYITPNRESAREISDAGADVIALDATARARPEGESLRSIHDFAKNVLKRATMADVSTLDEGIAAGEEIGFDFVSTTLSGYTAASSNGSVSGPDFDLIEKLSKRLASPIIAEGRLRTPEDVRRAFNCGAFAVVVGTAITGIDLLVREFVQVGQNRPDTVGTFSN